MKNIIYNLFTIHHPIMFNIGAIFKGLVPSRLFHNPTIFYITNFINNGKIILFQFIQKEGEISRVFHFLIEKQKEQNIAT